MFKNYVKTAGGNLYTTRYTGVLNIIGLYGDSFLSYGIGLSSIFYDRVFTGMRAFTIWVGKLPMA